MPTTSSLRNASRLPHRRRRHPHRRADHLPVRVRREVFRGDHARPGSARPPHPQVAGAAQEQVALTVVLQSVPWRRIPGSRPPSARGAVAAAGVRVWQITSWGRGLRGGQPLGASLFVSVMGSSSVGCARRATGLDAPSTLLLANVLIAYSAKGARCSKSTEDTRVYPGMYLMLKSAMKLSLVVLG